MNKIVRILPGIFLSLLSLSSCDGLFTEDCIYKGYLHARNGFHHPSDCLLYTSPSPRDA